MKRLVILLVLLLVMGCGRQDSAESGTTSAPTTGGQGASSVADPQQPSEPTLADKLMGLYTHVAENFTVDYEFLDNGAIESGGFSGMWSIENGEVVTVDRLQLKRFFRIEANGDLTNVAAAFGADANREEIPPKDQFTWKRIKSSVSSKAQAAMRAKMVTYVDRKIRLRALKPTGPLGAADLARVRSFSSEKYEEDEPFYFAPQHSKMPYVNDLTLLAGLTKLEKLILPGNRITKLDSLAGLTELRELDLRRNRITDLRPLAGMKKLEDLKLQSNYLSDAEVERLQKALPNCKIGHFSL